MLRGSKATSSLGFREAPDPIDDWGFHGQTWKPGPARLARDNGVDRSRHLYNILEEDINNDLELEDEGPGHEDHNNCEECMEGPQVLEVVIGQASMIKNNPVEPLQVNPLRGIEFVPI